MEGFTSIWNWFLCMVWCLENQQGGKHGHFCLLWWEDAFHTLSQRAEDWIHCIYKKSSFLKPATGIDSHPHCSSRLWYLPTVSWLCHWRHRQYCWQANIIIYAWNYWRSTVSAVLKVLLIYRNRTQIQSEKESKCFTQFSHKNKTQLCVFEKFCWGQLKGN